MSALINEHLKRKKTSSDQTKPEHPLWVLSKVTDEEHQDRDSVFFWQNCTFSRWEAFFSERLFESGFLSRLYHHISSLITNNPPYFIRSSLLIGSGVDIVPATTSPDVPLLFQHEGIKVRKKPPAWNKLRERGTKSAPWTATVKGKC